MKAIIGIYGIPFLGRQTIIDPYIQFKPNTITTIVPTLGASEYQLWRQNTLENAIRTFSVETSVPNEILNTISTSQMEIRLRAGTYRFRFKRNNNWGLWSSEVVIPAGILGKASRRSVVTQYTNNGATIISTNTGFSEQEILTDRGATITSRLDYTSGVQINERTVKKNNIEEIRNGKIYIVNDNL